MAKRVLKNRTRIGGIVGKVQGRSRGPLVFSEVLNRKTTQKIIDAIEKNKG